MIGVYSGQGSGAAPLANAIQKSVGPSFLFDYISIAREGEALANPTVTIDRGNAVRVFSWRPLCRRPTGSITAFVKAPAMTLGYNGFMVRYGGEPAPQALLRWVRLEAPADYKFDVKRNK